MPLSKQIAIEVLVAASVGFLLGLLGPFGSYAMPFAWRMAYWVAFTIIGYGLFRPVALVAGWLADSSVVPLWLCRILAIALAAVPMTWVVAFAMNGMSIPARPDQANYTSLYFQVAGIGAAIYGLTVFLFPHEQSDTITEAPDNDPRQLAIDPPIDPVDQKREPPPLLKRLPPSFAPPILALTVEDHYVRVFNGKGSEMLLMRLSDAIAEMAPVQGMQVHRSWWVADEAVTGAISIGRNIRLQLSNDMQVPVSRANISSARGRGWLEKLADVPSVDV